MEGKGRTSRVTKRRMVAFEAPGSASAAAAAAAGTKVEGEDVDLPPLCPGDYYDIDEVKKRYPGLGIQLLDIALLLDEDRRLVEKVSGDSIETALRRMRKISRLK